MSDQERDRVDVTFMYAVHDAFQRDLDRLAAMADAGDAAGPAVQAGWDRFTRFLHIHHTAEDTHLWPVLRAKGADPAVLDRMEAEHGRLDDLLDAVDAAVRAGDASRLAVQADRLADGLGAHCEHEEEQALPLVRLLYRAVWRPRYLRAPRWQSPARAH